ncbi:MAG: hypothetical protein JW986_04250 [Methanotrichaceae archaeon]|nr:hypothetical protein [Methanotrichaceae archaeon]
MAKVGREGRWMRGSTMRAHLYRDDLWRMGQEERAFEEAHPQVVDDTAT